MTIYLSLASITPTLVGVLFGAFVYLMVLGLIMGIVHHITEDLEEDDDRDQLFLRGAIFWPATIVPVLMYLLVRWIGFKLKKGNS